MKKENIKYGLMSAICVVLFALIALYSNSTESTDMIMPAIYIIEGMTKWYVLLLTLVVETVFVKFFLKESYVKAIAISLVMNLFTTVVGFLSLLVVGLVTELILIPLNTATYHVTHWIVNFLLIVLMNAGLEKLIVRLVFKIKSISMYLWLCLANAATIIICILCNLSWISHMYF